jgi:hypothetical protein
MVFLQACGSSGGTKEKEDIWAFFEVYNGNCQYAYIVDEELTELCTGRFVHAKSKSGTYFFVYYFEGDVSIVISGDRETWRGDEVFMDVNTVSFLAKGEDNDDIGSSGQCGLVMKNNYQFAVCDVSANGKKLEFVFRIKERVQ